jgi:hypothetical protein
MLSTINIACARNKCLAHADLLLLPPLPLPPLSQQQQPQQPLSNSGSNISSSSNSSSAKTMWMKTCHKAIAQFSNVLPNNNAAGASAIFKLLQARPALLEKRLPAPNVATVAAAAATRNTPSPHERKSCAETTTTSATVEHTAANKTRRHANDNATVASLEPEAMETSSKNGQDGWIHSPHNKQGHRVPQLPHTHKSFASSTLVVGSSR